MKKIQLSKKSHLIYIPSFIEQDKTQSLKNSLIQESQWRDDKIKMFGKVFDQPRKVAFFGSPEISYTYSKIKMIPQGWSVSTKELTDKINALDAYDFNTCLLNLYRDGSDHMSWHCDNEPELGASPIVASLSLGEERDFFFRHKKDLDNKVELKLENGSLLLMLGECQNEFNHALPKRKKQNGERVNLTFRSVKKDLISPYL